MFVSGLGSIAMQMYRNTILETHFVFILLYRDTNFFAFCISVLKYIFGCIPSITIVSGADVSRDIVSRTPVFI